MMNIYPTNLTYELPLNKNDYIRIAIDLTVDRNNLPQKDEMKKVIENVFSEIVRIYKIT